MSIMPLVQSVLVGVIGWALVAPLAAAIPRRRDWLAVIGRQQGAFLDNSKYFFLQAGSSARNLRLVFVTESPQVCAQLARADRESLLFPSWRAVWFLMRCGSVVVDEAAWFRKFRFFLLIRAHRVQLWHGIPFKWIEAGLWGHELGRFRWASRPFALRVRLIVYRITGRRCRYAAVVVTSRFLREQSFRPSFDANSFPAVGYPRNDFGRSLSKKDCELAWSNVDGAIREKLARWRNAGRKLVLVAPTFRDSGTEPMQLNASTLVAVDAFAEAHGVEFLFKFHPSERNVERIAGRHFHVCARDSDIYPLMPYAAALVTDYSSIGMDFLLVDRPLLFLIPENDDYATRDRQLQFDPRTMMPGPVVPDWQSLLDALLEQWKHDTYASERALLRRKAFDDLPQSEAVPKLLSFMRDQGWIATFPTNPTR